MQKIILLIISAIMILPLDAGAEVLIKRGDTLDLNQCIEIALKKQPNIVAAMGNVNINQSRVGQAKSNYYPQINWTSGYSRISPATGVLLKGGSSYDEYLSNVNLSQTIYDFEKTSTQV